MKPGDVRNLQQAQWVFLQPWQLELAGIKRMLDAAQVSKGRLRIVSVPGNWMMPEAQSAAISALEETLSEIYPDNAVVYRDRARARMQVVEQTVLWAREFLPPEQLQQSHVLVNERQAPLVRWLGLNVAATFNRPEDWSVAEVERLIAAGRDQHVCLVIDNLQSGGHQMSQMLARDTGAAHVILSNFPGGFPETGTWETAFRENINRLRIALQR